MRITEHKIISSKMKRLTQVVLVAVVSVALWAVAKFHMVDGALVTGCAVLAARMTPDACLAAAHEVITAVRPAAACTGMT